jgi:hypothetical protein
VKGGGGHLSPVGREDKVGRGHRGPVGREDMVQHGEGAAIVANISRSRQESNRRDYVQMLPANTKGLDAPVLMSSPTDTTSRTIKAAV